MLRSLKDIEQYTIAATDGNIGEVKDFYFDDDAWVIRYLIVDTGGWLASRKVLISPIAIDKPDWANKLLPVSITKAQVESSPDIDTDKPVSRQQETQNLGHYGFSSYWGGTGLWGSGLYPGMTPTGYDDPSEVPYPVSPQAQDMQSRAEKAQHQDEDLHLRSCKTIVDYQIQASDGDIGHVQSLIVDEETWAIQYMVVNTSNWWLGHEVLIAPHWIVGIDWLEGTVSVDLTRQAIKDAPPYDSTAQLNRAQEESIYKHYDRPGYWSPDVLL